jgi:hypothetical protein
MPARNIPQATDHPAHSLPAEARRPVSNIDNSQGDRIVSKVHGNAGRQSRPLTQVTAHRTSPVRTEFDEFIVSDTFAEALAAVDQEKQEQEAEAARLGVPVEVVRERHQREQWLKCRSEPLSAESLASTRTYVEAALAAGRPEEARIFAGLHGRTVDEILAGRLSDDIVEPPAAEPARHPVFCDDSTQHVEDDGAHWHIRALGEIPTVANDYRACGDMRPKLPLEVSLWLLDDEPAASVTVKVAGYSEAVEVDLEGARRARDLFVTAVELLEHVESQHADVRNPQVAQGGTSSTLAEVAGGVE